MMKFELTTYLTDALADAPAEAQAYAYTGGRAPTAGLPTVVFIHGAQHDHSVWAMQSRYFAHHGFNVLAVDLPGHARSTQAALSEIGAMGDWLIALLDAAGVERAMLVGHSMGSLIALDTAARFPQRVSALALVATAYPMQVSEALLNAALQREPDAIDMVNVWSHSTIAAKPSFPGPGFWMHGSNQRLMERIAHINPAQVLHTDFAACNAYSRGLEAAAQIRCPTLFVLGRRDQMTPLRAALSLSTAIAANGVTVETIVIDAGHAIMSERPDETLDALFIFAKEQAVAS
jgi:pimeloyl-ACP methyl ester carboxylesterase